MATQRSATGRLRGPWAASAVGITAEVTLGALLLGLSALAGLVFVHRPWPNRLDVWGYQVLPLDSGSRLAHDLVTLGSLTALVVGVVAVFVLGVLRDWVRALACAAAPLVAVLVVQDLAKPLVGRHIGLTGGSSYPSGTVAAVAALAVAFTLVMPRLLRPLVALAGAVVTVGVSAAVIVLRWHYPTDALGGIGVGMGSVLLVDGLAHIPWVVAALFRRVRPERGVEMRQQPSLV
jgi:membrane-associated phospholipid phosphatase